MAGKTKGEIMTQEQMIEAGLRKHSTSKIYKAESLQVSDEAISKLVNRGLSEMINADSGQKIDLHNAEMVKTVSKSYIKACADTSTLPSMAGLARAMGCSRTILYHWMNHNPDSETGQWLSMCHDLFSDLLSEGALRNNVNSIVAIFLQKAQYGLRDNLTIDVNQPQYDDSFDPPNYNYKDKYKNLIGHEE